LVKRIHGLKKARGKPPVFGGELGSFTYSVQPGDEVRCMGQRAIYLRIRNLSGDGSLVGVVVSFGEPVGIPFIGVRVGDLVEIAADCVLAVLPGAGEAAMGASAPETPAPLEPIAAMKQ
jgi:hypothetical protein